LYTAYHELIVEYGRRANTRLEVVMRFLRQPQNPQASRLVKSLAAEGLIVEPERQVRP